MQTSLNVIMHKIWIRKVPFFIVFFVVVLATYGFLTVIDFVPEPVDGSTEEEASATDVQEATEVSKAEEVEPIEADPYPTKIIFDSLGKEVNVLNPQSRAIGDLDAALLEGAVRHPDSADMSEDGNIFILAHSSYLPNVFNKNYQAFNGIQDLSWGDTVRLQSGNMEYVYFVEEVYKARASEVTVPETPGKAKLTLATCNSFGAKDDRFIVEAKLVEEKPL